MLKRDKERIVAELAERLKATETLIVADYRGLSMSELDGVRTELLQHGARFSVVKNTLTKRAAEEAGVTALLDLLEGPTAIAFVDGDMVAVAKTLSEAARRTRILELKGGILQGAAVTGEEVQRLATLPPADVLQSQVLGAVVGPLTMVVGLFTAPLRDLVGILDARIRQLEEQGEGAEPEAAEPEEVAEPEAAPAPEAAAEPDTAPEPEAAAEAEPAVEETEEPEAPAAEAAESEHETEEA